MYAASSTRYCVAPLRLRQRVDRVAQRRRQQHRVPRAGEARRGGTREVRRQIERIERAVELRAPEGEQRVEALAGDAAALPRREVGVLDRRAARTSAPCPPSRRRTPRPARGTARRATSRPSRCDASRARARDRGPRRRTSVTRNSGSRAMSNGVRARARDDRAPPRARAPRRGALERSTTFIDDRRRRIDDLHRRAVRFAGGEPRAQRLVPRDERVERATQRVDVERAGEPARDRHVVRRQPRRRAVEQPEQLLRERRRQRAAARHGRDRRVVPTRRRPAGGRAAPSPRRSRRRLGVVSVMRFPLPVSSAPARRAAARAPPASCVAPVRRASRRVRRAPRRPRATIASARPATVGAAKKPRSVSDTRKSRDACVTTRVASSEWPPEREEVARRRRRARGPARRPSAGRARAPRRCAAATARRPCAATCGAGSARRSTLPFGESGHASSRTSADGTMHLGQRATQRRRHRRRASTARRGAT